MNATKEEIKGRLIFGPIMLIMGIALFMFWSTPKMKEAKAVKQWSQTDGRITEAAIVAHKNGHEYPHSRSNPVRYRNEEGYKFRVETKYVYTVDSVVYSCKKRDLMEDKTHGTSKFSRAEMKRNYYNSHDKVTVYYNPLNPKEAVLKNGLSVWQWLIILTPLLMPVIGLLLLFSALKVKFSS